MNDQRLEARLADWYGRSSPAPESLSEAVLRIPDLTDGITPTVRWRAVSAWRATGSARRFAIATAAVVVVAIVGSVLLWNRDGNVSGGAVPSLQPDPSPQASPSPAQSSPAPAQLGPYPSTSGYGGSGNAGPYVGPDRHSVVADGVAFSFSATAGGWESHEHYLSKSTSGPQDAEGIVFWAGFPVSERYQPCFDLLGRPAHPSVEDLAAAASTVAGTDHVVGPMDVTVGGQPAMFVSFILTYGIVGNPRSCSPGVLFSWETDDGGAMWGQAIPGDTIRVWILEIDGRILVIEGATHWDASPELEQEIQQVVDSIRFG